jgi:polar amino acid transport system substrate-binding protein
MIISFRCEATEQIHRGETTPVLPTNINTVALPKLQQLVTFDTFNLALVDLNAGTIDAVVLDEIYGRYVISQTPNMYRVMTEDFGDETYGIGFRLGNTTIKNVVNDTLFDLIESGDALAISQKWFAEDVFLTRES